MAYANLFAPNRYPSQSEFRSPIEDLAQTQSISSPDELRLTNTPDAIVLQQIRRMQSLFSEFYSGSQVRVFIGDIRLDTVGIGWNASQVKTPVYGYASHKYDAIMRGTFIIQGELTIAFKESAYMHLLNGHLKQRIYRPSAVENDVRKLGSIPPDKIVSFLRAGFAGASPVIGTVKDEDGTSRVVISDNTLEDMLGGNFEFDTLASSMEELIWGIPNSWGERQGSKALTRVDEMDLQTFVDRNGMSYQDIGPGHTLLITYGNMDDPSANQTIKTLSDVHFLDSSQSIDSSTGFVVEHFRFFAKSIDEPAGPLANFPLPERQRAELQTLQPIVRNYSLTLTTGIDPITPAFETSVLQDMEMFIDSVVREINGVEANNAQRLFRSEHSGLSPDSRVRVTISVPTDWTVSSSSYDSVTTLSPVSRMASLDLLVSVIIEDVIKHNVYGKPIEVATNRVSGITNEILIEVFVL